MNIIAKFGTCSTNIMVVMAGQEEITPIDTDNQLINIELFSNAIFSNQELETHSFYDFK